MTLLSRRVFIRSAGEGFVAAAWLPLTACADLGRGEDAGGSSDAGAAPDAGARPLPPAGLCLPFLTPTDAFFRQFGGQSTVEGWVMPELDAATHRIAIEGLVERPMQLDLATLETDVASHVTVVNTLMCILGFRGTALWTGVPLRGLLDDAGIDLDRAVRVRFFGADGFENNLRVESIYDSPTDIFEPLLAFRINGAPLPKELGFPVRLLLADRYGFKNTKWLARIEVTDVDAETGQYQERGYPDEAEIEPVTFVETQRVRERVRPGPLEICGFALSGAAGIDVVEVARAGADFAPAEDVSLDTLRGAYPQLETTEQLSDPERYGYPFRGVWLPWRVVVAIEPGVQRVEIRVRDLAGNVADHVGLEIEGSDSA